MDEAASSPARRQRRLPLLATKLLIPPARQSLVARPRLAERLSACSDHGLTLVSAPAGFGKTTLLSTYMRQAPLPVAWLSLDGADNDPTRFLAYLVAALQRIDPAIGADLLDALETAQPPPVEPVVGALVNDLTALSTDFLLVLDDFHTIHEASVHEAIRLLVNHQPPQMHLVISTREDPPLPLARLRARGELLELRAQDLRFTLAEVSSFLEDVMGLALEAEDVDELDARVEGWVAGLQLAALSLQQRPNPAELIATLSGSHRFILSYLTDEVLSHLSPDVRSFLLATSVLDRLTGSLCDAVTDRVDGEAMLDQLCASNVFLIALDESHDWYRYHHLFAELLRSQLKRTQPELVPIVHSRASRWYESEGSAAEAIEHAFAAGDYGRAAHLVELHANEVTLQGYAQTVEGWLRRLPQEWRVTGPQANLAFARSLVLRGQLDDVEVYLQNAETAATGRARSGASLEASGILAEAKAVRAILVSIRGDAEKGYALATEAVRQAPPDDPYVQGIARFALGTCCNYAGRVVEAVDAYRHALPLSRSAHDATASMLIVTNLALLHVVRGHLRAAAELCREVVSEAERSTGPRSPLVASVYCTYSGVLYEWGRLEDALAIVERWLELSKRGGHVGTLAYANALLSRIRQARNDSAGADRALDEARRALRRGVPAWVASEVVAQQVALALGREDDEGAANALASSDAGVHAPADHSREVIHIARLRLLHHQGRQAPQGPSLSQALDLADRLLVSAESAGRMGRVIEILALRALTHQAQGKADRALDDLSRALALAEPEGYLRLFVDLGPPMARRLRAARLARVRPTYLARLLAAFPDEPTASIPQTDLVAPLTERELEVLRLIAKGLRYEDVARELVVSLNTVRFHVKGIYGKLGVDNRTAAIDAAKVLGLL